MKLKTYFNATLLCLAAGLLAACADDDIVGNNSKDLQPKEEVKGVRFTTNEAKLEAPTRVSVNEDGTTRPQTRTYIKHTAGGGADAYWNDNDKIWVKNKNGQWKQSISTDLYDNGRRAVFILPGDATDYNDNCTVIYANADYNSPWVQSLWPTGATPVAPLTHVDYQQDQTTPNDFSKAGERGDCGIGKAKTSDGRKFDFTLEHRASYLCLQPRCDYFRHGELKLTRIILDAGITYLDSDVMELREDGTIHFVEDKQGYYDYANPQMNGYVNNFPLMKDDFTYSPEINACYFVVLPGTHSLDIHYTVHGEKLNLDYTFKKRIENLVCKPGEIYDITSNLAMPRPKYYFWDAQTDMYGEIPYYDEHSGFSAVNYTEQDMIDRAPKDPHYNPSGRFDAETERFKKLPNVNEMMWYAYKGDAHWVDDGQGDFCSWAGLLCRPAGIWLKKKATILRDEHITKEYMHKGYPNKNGVYTDFRETYAQNDMPDFVALKTGTPTNIDDYFFLPAAGEYDVWGSNAGVNTEGSYWSSSRVPKSTMAYSLYFYQGNGIKVVENGYTAVPTPFQ